jgi:tryptophan synthase alpha chain
MKTLEANRLVRTFAALAAEGKKTLLPFLTAGFPDLDTTRALLHDFEARGVRVCELGVPFSDPIADGPVIQASYTQALAAGVTSGAIFEMVRRYREESGPGGLALVAMVSYSIVFRHDPKRFLKDASAAGIDGVIIPDLPLGQAPGTEALAASLGLANIMLVAPSTPEARRLDIARHSRGFIYFISVAGITGERDRLPAATIAAVAELRRHTGTPVCVGFGVSNAATVAQVCAAADGAIVGSAIVHRIADAAAKKLPRARLVKQVGDFVSELLAPVE